MTLMGFKHHTDTKPLRVDIYQYIVNVNAVPVQTKKGTCHVSRCHGGVPPVPCVPNVPDCAVRWVAIGLAASEGISSE